MIVWLHRNNTVIVWLHRNNNDCVTSQEQHNDRVTSTTQHCVSAVTLPSVSRVGWLMKGGNPCHLHNCRPAVTRDLKLLSFPFTAVQWHFWAEKCTECVHLYLQSRQRNAPNVFTCTCNLDRGMHWMCSPVPAIQRNALNVFTCTGNPEECIECAHLYQQSRQRNAPNVFTCTGNPDRGMHRMCSPVPAIQVEECTECIHLYRQSR